MKPKKREPGYFNEDNYYSFELEKDGVLVMSECCGDTLDFDAAVELRNLLCDWIDSH